MEDIADIDWSIYVTGGILKLINVSSDGLIKNLAVDNETTLKTDKPVFGLGRVTIAVNIKIGTKAKQGFVIGPFVFIF